MLTQKRLRELLEYDPATGVFTWLVNRRGRGARKGARAGTINGEGYRQICIDCVFYRCSRLAVLWMTGRWPRRLVDHRNRNRSDDRWRNLRHATNSQNSANSGDRKSGVSLKGVTLIERKGKGTQRHARPYQAQIRVNYRNIYLGCFDTPEEAHAAYAVAAREHFGEFARGA